MDPDIWKRHEKVIFVYFWRICESSEWEIGQIWPKSNENLSLSRKIPHFGKLHSLFRGLLIAPESWNRHRRVTFNLFSRIWEISEWEIGQTREKHLKNPTVSTQSHLIHKFDQFRILQFPELSKTNLKVLSCVCFMDGSINPFRMNQEM